MWKNFKRAARGPFDIKAEYQLSKAPRLGACLIFCVFTILFAVIGLSACTSVPKIVRAVGEVVPAGSYHRVESAYGGVVASIHVADGQHVKEGQTLVILENDDLLKDESALLSERGTLEVSIRNNEAILHTLGKSMVPSRTELEELRAEGLLRAIAVLEAFSETGSQLTKQIAQQKTAVLAFQQQVEVNRLRADRAMHRLAVHTTLYNQGAISQIQLSEYEDKVDELLVAVAASTARLAEQELSVGRLNGSLQGERVSLIEVTVQEIEDAKQQLTHIEATLAIVQDKLRNLHLKAPVAGVIQAVEYPTIGSIVDPSETVYEILPAEENLLAEVHIPIEDLGHISHGDRAFVTIDGFDARRFGKVEARLSSISPVPIEKEGTNTKVFRTLFELNVLELVSEGLSFPIRAGYKTSIEIGVGEQTLLSSLLAPVYSTLEQAFSER